MYPASTSSPKTAPFLDPTGEDFKIELLVAGAKVVADAEAEAEAGVDVDV